MSVTKVDEGLITRLLRNGSSHRDIVKETKCSKYHIYRAIKHNPELRRKKPKNAKESQDQGVEMLHLNGCPFCLKRLPNAYVTVK